MTDGWTHLLAEAPDDLQAMLKHAIRDDLVAALDALTAGDAAHVAYIAHRLKGSARLYGDKVAAAFCAALEAAGQTGDIGRARVMLTALEHAFGTACGTACGARGLQ